MAGKKNSIVMVKNYFWLYYTESSFFYLGKLQNFIGFFFNLRFLILFSRLLYILIFVLKTIILNPHIFFYVWIFLDKMEN